MNITTYTQPDDYVKINLIDYFPFRKPVIPVHHMEAHALIARLMLPIEFPFLALLVSGGHCILVVCENFGRFFRLGEGLDDAPGEAFDKVSRMLRLRYHPLGRDLCGGAAIESIAILGDPSIHSFPKIMAAKLVHYRDSLIMKNT